MDKTGVYVEEFKYTEDFTNGSGGQDTMYISMREPETVCISTTSTKDDAQHDFSVSVGDWEFIKRAIDNHFKRIKEAQQ